MLDFVRDLYASFRQTSLERVKSPFLGAFVFSWLGFNWQILSILFFSKKDIEQKIEIINKSYDVGNYLLGPILTTSLIVIFLPQINKLITKIQDKPNSDTIELSLSSKIRIAELQQSIAEIEARKKLADKKEERNIEEGIENIKAKLQMTIDQLNEKNEEVQNIQTSNTDLQGRIAKAESKLTVEQESKSELQKELTIEKESYRILANKTLDITNELNKSQADLTAEFDINRNLTIENDNLRTKVQKMTLMFNHYKEAFPDIFEVIYDGDLPQLAINSNARPLLKNVNKSLNSSRINNGIEKATS